MSGRMMVVLAALASCQRQPARVDPQTDSDCTIVAQDPAHAMARVTEHYPHDAAKVAEVIETCIAPPGGDECERLVKILHGIPMMTAVGSAVASGAEALAVCRGMPPEMRRCMLPSYALGHLVECDRIQRIIVNSATHIAEEQHSLVPVPRDCPVPHVTLAPAGMTIAAAGTPAVHLARGDLAGMGAVLRGIKAREDRCTQLELDGELGVRYQEVVDVMDLATQVGFVDVALGDGGSAGSAAAGSAAADQPAAAPPGQAQDLETAPVVVVTRTELMIGRTSVATVADALAGSGDIPGLAHALPPPNRSPATAIIQADKATDVAVINHVIATLQHAGYDNILFAVKNK